MTTGQVANSVDPDWRMHSAMFALALLHLLGPLCQSTLGRYGILWSIISKQRIYLGKFYNKRRKDN